ncbi:indole-3-glycerol phosphate synthase TrpC [Sulfobacillus harzensis]|uniref:Indole-3-glycerol phosphate synthase n=1 Tax=Sulfobacillus harzensis TaxID=2729629 RepID=A0A7Y0L5S4_9FIRM|nr:indole-3-glycerol phosphate synthase TrpC [Sulfobacillus harzensis]NMP22419.1 indole-3-glycerol phosphate synthase TrpC [Sulfobacillus harzensis]
MFLDSIVGRVDERVKALRTQAERLEKVAASMTPVRSLAQALSASPDRVSIIAECKQKSPSKGWLTHHYDPQALARQYQEDGASAISVLTEPYFFAGDLEHLKAVKASVDLPVLRKDFVRDPLQLVEARAAGADAALLIVRIVDDVELHDLYQAAAALNLEVLVEIHSPSEAERALKLNPRIIGVNNRDLDSFETRLSFSEEMAHVIPADVIRVSESGIQSVEDLHRIQDWGYQAALVGESLVKGSGLLRGYQD